MIDVRPVPLLSLTEEERKARTEKIRAAVERADKERAKAYMEIIRNLKAAATESRRKRALGITELPRSKRAVTDAPPQPSPANSKTSSQVQEKSSMQQAKSSSPDPSSQASQSSPATAGGTKRSISAELRKWSKLFLRVRWAQIERADREAAEMEAAAQKELEEIRKELLENRKRAMKAAKTVAAKSVTPANEQAINEFLDAWKDGM